MKKRMIVLVAVLSVIALAISVTVGVFANGIFLEKIIRPQNVYEEIWNMVWTEQHTPTQTVLTTATADASVDYDFGVEFVGIHIPACHTTINWETENEELSWLFPIENGKYVHFIYNYKTKTLYGNRDIAYLTENFLTAYFQWCEDAADFNSGFALTDLGPCTFVYADPLYDRHG